MIVDPNRVNGASSQDLKLGDDIQRRSPEEQEAVEQAGGASGRVAKYERRNREKGLAKTSLWVPADKLALIKEIGACWRAGKPLPADLLERLSER